MSKYCIQCGRQLSDDDLFCTSCGTRQEVIDTPVATDNKQKTVDTIRRCIRCGNALENGDLYCAACGTIQEVIEAPVATEGESRHCIKCGEKLEEAALFCTACGAKQNVIAPSTTILIPQKKRRKKTVLFAVCGIVIMSSIVLMAILLWNNNNVDELGNQRNEEHIRETEDLHRIDVGAVEVDNTPDETNDVLTHGTNTESNDSSTDNDVANVDISRSFVISDALYEKSDTSIYRIPYIEIEGVSTDAVNTLMYNAISPSLDYAHQYPDVLTCINYAWNYHDGIVSIVSWIGPKPGGWTEYFSWNVSIETGMSLTVSEIANHYGMTEEDFFNKAKALLLDKIHNHPDVSTISEESLQQIIAEVGSQDNLELIRPFINSDGKLCIAGITHTFAGGGMYYLLFEFDNGEEFYNLTPAIDWNAVYTDKISEYRQALTIGAELFDENYDYGNDCSSINALMVRYSYSYGGGIYYTIFDIDENGTAELIFSDLNSIIDIYIVKNGSVIKLFEDCYFGERSRLHILTNGRLLSEGSSGASSALCEMYRIDNPTETLSLTEAYYCDGNGPSSHMRSYTYMSEDEYYDMVNNWIKDSIFETFTWTVIAENSVPDYSFEADELTNVQASTALDASALKDGDIFSVSGIVQYSTDPCDVGEEYCILQDSLTVSYLFTDIFGETSQTQSDTFFCIGSDIDLLRPYIGQQVTITGALRTECHGIAYVTNISVQLDFSSQAKQAPDYNYTEPDAEESHTHSFGSWSNSSSTSHVRTCSCGEKETEAHFFDSGKVTKEPTSTTTGVKTYTCTKCNVTKTETIPKLEAHTHSYGNWYENGFNHSRSCSCGDTETEAHSWNSGTVTKEPTTSSTGTMTYTCTECGATETDTIPKLDAPITDEPDTYTFPLTCGSCSHTDGYHTVEIISGTSETISWTCSACGAECSTTITWN